MFNITHVFLFIVKNVHTRIQDWLIFTPMSGPDLFAYAVKIYTFFWDLMRLACVEAIDPLRFSRKFTPVWVIIEQIGNLSVKSLH